MAKTENVNGSAANWVQPISYFATVDKDGNGRFIRVPDMPELQTVAEVHGANAAEKLHDMIVRAFNSGYKEDGRDRVSMFDKKFSEHPSVRQYVRDAAAAKGVANPTDEQITNTILSPKYRDTLVAKFGDEVAAAGYVPTTRARGGASTPKELDIL